MWDDGTTSSNDAKITLPRAPNRAQQKDKENETFPRGLQPQGFRNRELRPLIAQALGLDNEQITQGKMSYDLRRLRLHGLIERIDGTHRYQLTARGRRTALFYSRAFNRVLRPGLSQIAHPDLPPDGSNLTAAFHHLEVELTNYFAEKKAA